MSKYKLKSSSSISKRFKVTGTKKILRQRACRSHLLGKKTAQHKQKLRKVVRVQSADLAPLLVKIL